MRVNAKTGLFRTLALIPALLVAVVGYWIHAQCSTPERQGKNLNRRAWESSYVERGDPAPESGPREGYWGARLGPKTPDMRVGWREPETRVGGLLEIDHQGHQRFQPKGDPDLHLMVLGGSVAFGAYASRLDTVYFQVLGRSLERRGIRARVTVVASGAWKSSQELAALRSEGAALQPELVVFFNGLNDLTIGARADTWEGVRTDTKDGSLWTKAYHEHDYAERVEAYLINMGAAARWARSHGARLLVVMQPALFERTAPSEIEALLLRHSLAKHASLAALREAYAEMRAGLDRLAGEPDVFFLDGSRLLNAEQATTFSDLWHFSDPGHRIVGHAIAAKVSEIRSGGRAN